MSYDVNWAAVIKKKYERATTTDRLRPIPGVLDLLVRNHAVALNTEDCKSQDTSYWIKKYPTVFGSDVCGIVSAVGELITKFKVGDRVGGFAAVTWLDKIDHGAFQTYTLLREISTYCIPESMTFEQGAVFPMAMAKACMGLFEIFGIPRPQKGLFRPRGQLREVANPDPNKAPVLAWSYDGPEHGILLWSGSSSLGNCMIQICHVLGVKTYVTASLEYHEALLNLGAHRCFAIDDPHIDENIIAATKQDEVFVRLAYHCMEETGSSLTRTAQTLRKLREEAEHTIIEELPILGIAPWSHEDIKGIDLRLTLPTSICETSSNLAQWFFNEWLQTALELDEIVAAPEIEIIPGGIRHVQDALNRQKQGVDGKKLVLLVE